MSKLNQKTIDRIVKMVPDMEAFVKVALSIGREELIVTTIMHDILGVIANENLPFSPRTSGYAKEVAA